MKMPEGSEFSTQLSLLGGQSEQVKDETLVVILKLLQKNAKLTENTKKMPTLVKEAVELSLMSLSKANVQSQANYSDLLLMIIKQFPSLPVSRYLKAAKCIGDVPEELSPQKKMFFACGKILYYFVLLKAEKFTEATDEDLQTVMKNIKLTMKGYPSLDILCGEAVKTLIQQVTFDQYQGMVSHVACNGWSKSTLNSLSWTLTAHSKGFISGSHLKEWWGSNKFVKESDISQAAKLIMVACDSYPIIHPAVLGVCKWLHKEDNFKHLWIHLTETILPKSDTVSFLHLLTVICKELLPLCNSSAQVSLLLHKNLLADLSYLEIKDNSLKTAFTQMTDNLCECMVLGDSTLQISVVKTFTNVTSIPNTLYVTALNQLYLKLSEKTAEIYVQQLLTDLKTEKWDKHRHTSKEIIRTICHHSVDQQQLFVYCYQKASQQKNEKSKSAEITAGRTICRNLFEKSVYHSVKGNSKNSKERPATHLVTYIDQVCGCMKKDIAALPKKEKESWNKLIKLIHKLNKINPDELDSKRDAFLLVCIFVTFLLISETVDEHTLLVDDLCSCVEEAFKTKKKQNKNQEKDDWIVVFTELILSLLLSHSMLTSSICYVFTMLKSQFTDQAIGLLLDVLNREADSSGVINNEEEEEEEEEEEDEEEEADEENDVSGDEDEIEMSEDEEHNEEALSKEQQLKKRLRESLGDVLAPSDEEADSEEDLDDDVMMKVDAMIIDKNEVKKQVEAFKNRCMSVISSLISVNDGDIHIHLLILQSLLQVPRNSAKIDSLVKELCSTKKNVVKSDIDLEYSCKLLANLFEPSNFNGPISDVMKNIVNFLLRIISTKEARAFGKQHKDLTEPIIQAVVTLLKTIEKNDYSRSSWTLCKSFESMDIFRYTIFWTTHEDLLRIAKKCRNNAFAQSMRRNLAAMLNPKIQSELSQDDWNTLCSSCMEYINEAVDATPKKEMKKIGKEIFTLFERIVTMAPEMEDLIAIAESKAHPFHRICEKHDGDEPVAKKCRRGSRRRVSKKKKTHKKCKIF